MSYDSKAAGEAKLTVVEIDMLQSMLNAHDRGGFYMAYAAMGGSMRRLAIFASILVALFGLSACGEEHSWRQKTTLEVETPNGVVSGGSVNEMTVEWFGGIELRINSSAVIARTRGEASFLEVAPNRYLFALLRDGEAFETAEVFREAGDNRETRPITARLEKLRERRTVPPSLYPMLVTFADITKPETVQLVDPANLAATFGEGYALKGISVEITDEKVSEGAVEQVLGWVNEHNPIFLENWKDFPADHPLRNISKFSFKIGA